MLVWHVQILFTLDTFLRYKGISILQTPKKGYGGAKLTTGGGVVTASGMSSVTELFGGDVPT